MAMWLKQSTSVDVGIGPFLDEADGKTAETTLTITQADIRLKKNNGNWAQKNAAQTLSHEENGWYEVTLDATDTGTLGILIVAIHESGALPVWREFLVVPANVWDSYFSTDLLQVHAAEISNDLITASAIAANAIGSSEIADGAITAAKIATDAIDADALAADAIAEINATVDTALSDYDGPTHAELVSEINSVQSDIAGLNNLSAAAVNAEVVDALATDTYAEPGQGNPAATASLSAKIGYLYKAWRNRHTQTATEYALYADDATTKDQEAVVSDDGATFERGEVSTGA